MICKHCGKENADTSTYCLNCGTLLKTDDDDFVQTTVLNNGVNQYTEQRQPNSQNVNPTGNMNQQPVYQTPATQAVGMQSTKKKKLSTGAIMGIVIGCVVIVAIILAIIVIGSSSSSDYDSYDDSAYSDNTSANFSLDYDTGITMSDNIFDYQIKIGNIVYQFPMTVQDFMATGIEFSQYENPSDKVSSGYTQLVTFEYSDGSTITAELCNFTKSETEYSNCHVVGVIVNGSNGELLFDAAQVSIAKEITLNTSTISDVENAFGEPSDIVKAEEYSTTTYEYSEDFYKLVELHFDENDILTSIKIENVTTPDNVVESGVSNETPQLVSSYKQPGSLGSDLTSGNYELEGVLYKLPTPISEFIANGWKITEQDSKTIAGKDYTYCVLSNGNAELDHICVKNYEEYEIPIENGVITQITSTSFTYGKDGTLLFPKDISFLMSADKFEYAIKEADYTTEKTETDVRYYFQKDSINTQIYVEDNKVNIIAMYWEKN